MRRLNWAELNELSSQFGESFYVLDDRKFEKNFCDLQSAFRTRYEASFIGYSYKTNYTPYLCRLIDGFGGYAEVVSEMEYELAERIGVEQRRIILNGPMKSEACMARALHGGSLVNLDSLRDLNILKGIAESCPEAHFEVALRCNFPIRSQFVSRFGFDIEGDAFKFALATIEKVPNIELVGLHCHFPDRDLDSYRKRAARMLELSDRIFRDAPPKYLNFGGGFFGAMSDAMMKTFAVKHVNFEEYADAVAGPVAKAYGACGKKPRLFIEPGTAIVADTLHFFARVVDVKQVAGTRFTTVNGSIFNISASARKTNLPVEVVSASSVASRHSRSGPCTIVGYTCIESDCLTVQFDGAADVGDFVHYSNVGSYSVVMKPPFILPNVAMVRFDRDSWEPKLVKAPESFEDVFSTFVF